MASGTTRTALKTLGHLLGVIVNCALMLQAVSLLRRPQTDDLINFCHWLGQGLSFAMLGIVGMVIEFIGECRLSSKGLKGFMKMMTHSLLLTCYYFVLGCCAIGGLRAALATMDGKNHTYHVADSTVSLRLLEMVIGYCAWGAAGFNLLASCCLGGASIAGKEDEDFEVDEEKQALLQRCEEAKLPKNPFGPKEEGHESVSSSRRTTAASSLNGSWISTQSSRKSSQNQLAESTPETAFEAPPGGWSFAADTKPFGSY